MQFDILNPVFPGQVYKIRGVDWRGRVIDEGSATIVAIHSDVEDGCFQASVHFIDDPEGDTHQRNVFVDDLEY